jgi:hypothetical protein
MKKILVGQSTVCKWEICKFNLNTVLKLQKDYNVTAHLTA